VLTPPEPNNLRSLLIDSNLTFGYSHFHGSYPRILKHNLESNELVEYVYLPNVEIGNHDCDYSEALDSMYCLIRYTSSESRIDTFKFIAYSSETLGNATEISIPIHATISPHVNIPFAIAARGRFIYIGK
jgi:hypothetical protein